MQIKYIISFLVVFLQCQLWASGRLLSATTSSDQDVFRLELQFDDVVDPNKVGIQFVERSLVLSIPDTEVRKNLPALETKVDFIGGLKVSSTKDKEASVEIQFLDVQALQMKENLALEGLGKGLIIEVLPPLWNKTPAPGVMPATAVNDATKVSETPQTTAPIKDEKEIPLFEKKEGPTSESSGLGKISFMVVSVIALGAYLIWWLKNRSKMVNGPESVMKIKVITQFHLGPKKTLAVVRVAGESLLLGITESQISLIKTLSLLDEDLPEVSTENFADALRQQAPSVNLNRKKPEADLENANEMISDEEFSFGPAVKTTLTQKIPMLRRMI
jgi:flagellar protein FliO/FliZ